MLHWAHVGPTAQALLILRGGLCPAVRRCIGWDDDDDD